MVSLVPRLLPDFISQPWRKIGIKFGSGLGTKLRHGDVTAGVKGVRTSIAFVVLEVFYFHSSLWPAQALVPAVFSKCKVQTRIQR